MTRTIEFLKHNAIALAALFVALGGTSYAAIALPKDSVGARQLRPGAVTSRKIRAGAITPGKLAERSFGGRILYLAEIENDGVVAASDPKGIKTEAWNMNTGGEVIFPRAIPRGCFPLASAASPMATTGGAPSVGAGINSAKTVVVALNAPIPVTLTIVCAR